MKKNQFEVECAKMKAKYGGKKPERAALATAEGCGAITTAEAARLWGRSEWWTRNYFRTVEDTLKLPSLNARRGTRKYVTVTIPIHVFERETAKFTHSCPKQLLAAALLDRGSSPVA